MAIKLTQLQCKEVICLENGQRLGYVEDIQVEVPEGRVVSLTVPGPGKCLGLCASRHEYCIPWNCIKKIGPDIILVDIQPDSCRVSRPKQGIRL